jgi:hypothetical protein
MRIIPTPPDTSQASVPTCAVDCAEAGDVKAPAANATAREARARILIIETQVLGAVARQDYPIGRAKVDPTFAAQDTNFPAGQKRGTSCQAIESRFFGV